MDFERNDNAKNIGKTAGFVFSYFLFTTVLFFVLIFTKKISPEFAYLKIMVFTLTITIIGLLLARFLK